MERCALSFMVPERPSFLEVYPKRNFTIFPPKPTFDVWSLNAEWEVNTAHLSWVTRPPRNKHLGQLIIEENSTAYLPEFHCESGSLLSFELACASCTVDFWQTDSLPRLGGWLLAAWYFLQWLRQFCSIQGLLVLQKQSKWISSKCTCLVSVMHTKGIQIPSYFVYSYSVTIFIASLPPGRPGFPLSESHNAMSIVIDICSPHRSSKMPFSQPGAFRAHSAGFFWHVLLCNWNWQSFLKNIKIQRNTWSHHLHEMGRRVQGPKIL